MTQNIENKQGKAIVPMEHNLEQRRNSMNKKKFNKSQKETIELFKSACNGLATSVNEQLFDGCRKWYWIGDEVGGACDFEETDVLNPEDMVRIIENGLTYDEYAEWREANLDNDRYINLKSWLMGARHDMFKEEKSNM